MPSNNTRKAHLERACVQCGTVFWPFHDRSRLCSRTCISASLRTLVERSCEHCHAAFTAQPSQVAQGKARYCSVPCADSAKRVPAIERFWSYVDKSGECWTWTGATDKDGYGVFWNDGYARAHQWSWMTHAGPIPEGHVVRHRCDNPPCVRPDHLLTGTTQDNVADRVARGRSRRATQH